MRLRTGPKRFPARYGCRRLQARRLIQMIQIKLTTAAAGLRNSPEVRRIVRPAVRIEPEGRCNERPDHRSRWRRSLKSRRRFQADFGSRWARKIPHCERMTTAILGAVQRAAAVELDPAQSRCLTHVVRNGRYRMSECCDIRRGPRPQQRLTSHNALPKRHLTASKTEHRACGHSEGRA